MPWIDARAVCLKKGSADLVTIDNARLNSWIKVTLLAEAASKVDAEGVRDGTDPTKRNTFFKSAWDPAEPDITTTSCVTLSWRSTIKDMRWADENCQIALPFICEAPLTPTEELEGWTSYNGFRYAYYPDRTTQANAKASCEAWSRKAKDPLLLANLIWLESKQEETFVRNELLAGATDTYWNACERTSAAFFIWMSGDGGACSGAFSEGAYTNWMKGQPSFTDRSGKEEKCTETNSKDWNDVACSNVRAYVCKAKSGVDSTAATTAPSGAVATAAAAVEQTADGGSGEGKDEGNSASSGNPMGATLGGILGAFLFILILMLAVFYRKQRKAKEKVLLELSASGGGSSNKGVRASGGNTNDGNGNGRSARTPATTSLVTNRAYTPFPARAPPVAVAPAPAARHSGSTNAPAVPLRLMNSSQTIAGGGASAPLPEDANLYLVPANLLGGAGGAAAAILSEPRERMDTDLYLVPADLKGGAVLSEPRERMDTDLYLVPADLKGDGDVAASNGADPSSNLYAMVDEVGTASAAAADAAQAEVSKYQNLPNSASSSAPLVKSGGRKRGTLKQGQVGQGQSQKGSGLRSNKHKRASKSSLEKVSDA
eukprot:gene17153-8997_t